MNTTSAIEAREIGNRTVVAGIAAIVLILLVAAVLLFINLPDANAFNARVEQLFVENDTLTGNSEIKLLEILAGSGTAFSDTLSSYRFVIFVLLVFATALLIAAVAFLVMLVAMNSRMSQIERKGIEVPSLLSPPAAGAFSAASIAACSAAAASAAAVASAAAAAAAASSAKRFASLFKETKPAGYIVFSEAGFLTASLTVTQLPLEPGTAPLIMIKPRSRSVRTT